MTNQQRDEPDFIEQLYIESPVIGLVEFRKRIQSQIDSAVLEAEARPFINLDDGFYELNAMQITVSRDKFGNKIIKYMIPYATEQFLLQQSKQEGK